MSVLELPVAQLLLWELASEHCSESSALWVGGTQGQDAERVRVKELETL